jgi:hypothetical protein
METHSARLSLNEYPDHDMPQSAKIVTLATILIAMLMTACQTKPEAKSRRLRLRSILEHEMHSNTNWLRIHAAEGLLDNSESGDIADLFRPEADNAKPPYRIGVWRVLARSTMGDERTGYTERIRAVMLDSRATDRISAAESLGKLDAATRADRDSIFNWLNTADDATAAFPRWLLVLSSNTIEREHDEIALAKLLSSNDPVARLRAAFALGRLKTLSAHSVAWLRDQFIKEPSDSIARVYFITALLLHEKNASDIPELEKQLMFYANGKANEQLELGIAIGLRGDSKGLVLLEPLLNSPETDGRIGAANGMLRLLK